MKQILKIVNNILLSETQAIEQWQDLLYNSLQNAKDNYI